MKSQIQLIKSYYFIRGTRWFKRNSTLPSKNVIIHRVPPCQTPQIWCWLNYSVLSVKTNCDIYICMGPLSHWESSKKLYRSIRNQLVAGLNHLGAELHFDVHHLFTVIVVWGLSEKSKRGCYSVFDFYGWHVRSLYFIYFYILLRENTWLWHDKYIYSCLNFTKVCKGLKSKLRQVPVQMFDIFPATYLLLNLQTYTLMSWSEKKTSVK